MPREDQESITIHSACRNDYEALKKRLDKLEENNRRDPRLVAREVLKFEDDEEQGGSNNSNSSMGNYSGNTSIMALGDGLAVGLG